MKTGLIFIVALVFIARSPADGDGSEGVQCVNKCLWPESAGSGVARSVFQNTLGRSAADDRCTAFEKKLTCVEGCPAYKYVTLARETSKVWEKYCGGGVTDATREKFLADCTRLQDAWTSEFGKCGEEGTTPEETCTWADCAIGSALTTAKIGFHDDVVVVTVNAGKLIIGSSVELSGEKLPASCNPIFEPYEPQTPYPPYGPEVPYVPEAYQRNPYERNPYHRNPYRRHPYQRNSYQRNPYQSRK